MRLIIKYPTRSRPVQFRQTLEHYISMLADPDSTRFLFSCDTDDKEVIDPEDPRQRRRIPSMCSDELRAYISALPIGHALRYGSPKTKVDAINRDLNEYDYPWDMVLIAADDMLPNVFGYDNLIRDQFKEHGLDTLLWIDDGRQDHLVEAKKICTVACIGRTYYERDRFIYNPKYLSLYCDNEQQEVADRRGRLIKAPNWITNHSFQWGGTMRNDPLYRRNNRFWKTDERTFKQRQRAGFPA